MPYAARGNANTAMNLPFNFLQLRDVKSLVPANVDEHLDTAIKLQQRL